MVEKIRLEPPIINCNNDYYFPDEYVMYRMNGFNYIKVKKLERGIQEEKFQLQQCDIAKKTMADTSFVEAIIKKRENVLIAINTIEDTYKKTESAKKIQNNIESDSEKEIDDMYPNYDDLKPNEIAKVETVTKEEEAELDNELANPSDSFHDKGYYERMEYKAKIPKLQRAYAALEEWKKHNVVPKWGIHYPQELKDLNRDYNTLRARVMVLHYKWGSGSFDRIQRGSFEVIR